VKEKTILLSTDEICGFTVLLEKLFCYSILQSIPSLDFFAIDANFVLFEKLNVRRDKQSVNSLFKCALFFVLDLNIHEY